MTGSQNIKDPILSIYMDSRSVFRLSDVAMLTGISDSRNLSARMYYAVRTGKILNPRKGFYAKPGYNPEELACMLYAPSYLSLEYVLQKAGVVFQYDTAITAVSYLSREVEVADAQIRYRRMKGSLLAAPQGIIQQENVSIATPERAFLDTLYLNKSYYFDNLRSLDRQKVLSLLPLYGNKKLEERAKKMLEHV